MWNEIRYPWFFRLLQWGTIHLEASFFSLTWKSIYSFTEFDLCQLVACASTTHPQCPQCVLLLRGASIQILVKYKCHTVTIYFVAVMFRSRSLETETPTPTLTPFSAHFVSQPRTFFGQVVKCPKVGTYTVAVLIYSWAVFPYRVIWG